MAFRTRFFRLLCVLAHALYSLIEYCTQIVRRTVDLCHELFNNRPGSGPSFMVHKLEKVPTHVTVLLGPEPPSFKDLANIILWSIAVGISFISFYDCKGDLEKQHAELEYEVNKRKKPEEHVIWHGQDASRRKNGFTGRKIHVKILSGTHNGRGGIVDLSRLLAVSDKSEDISIDRIDSLLRTGFEFPDPELGINCGQKTFSLYGYPPWQSRVTEFLTIDTHRNISVQTFLNILQRYSKCEQRLGK